MKNSIEYLRKIGSEKFFVSLLPQQPLLQRERTWGLDGEEVIRFIQEVIPSSLYLNYRVSLSEFFPNELSGTIIVNSEGILYGEFLNGKHYQIVEGISIPQYFVQGMLGAFDYSFNDRLLQQAIRSAIRSIPHEGYWPDRKLRTGYYEVILIRREAGAPLTPIFLECREHPAYLL